MEFLRNRNIFFLFLAFVSQSILTAEGQSTSNIVRQSIINGFSNVHTRTHTSTLVSIPSTSFHISSTVITSHTSSMVTSSSYILPSSTLSPTPAPPTISLNVTIQIPSLVYDGEVAVFNCSVEPPQNATFEWALNGDVVANVAQFNTTLQYSNGDTYCCEVDNTFYRGFNHSCQSAPLVLFVSSVDLTQSQTNFITLQCTAKSSNSSLHSDITYFWQYMGRSNTKERINQQTNNYILSTNNRTLSITGSALTLSGRYICNAYLTGHVSTTKISFKTVQLYSRISLQLQDPDSPSTPVGTSVKVEIGEDLSLYCFGSGFPIQLLTWLVNGQDIKQTALDYTIVEISPIRSPPVIDGYVTETGEVTISVLIRNILLPIQSLTCVGNNIAGANQISVSVILLASPCLPEDVLVFELGEMWAVVQWKNGDSCVTGKQDVESFTIGITALDEGATEFITLPVSSYSSIYSYNVTNLHSDSFYAVNVSADNQYGSSTVSSAIIIHTLAPPESNGIIFPFGLLPGDSLVPHSSYAQSKSILFNPPLPIGNRLSSVVYLSPYGVLSFDTPFHYWGVQEFGIGSTIQDLYILAPFWSDVDYTSQGNLFYQLYHSSNTDNTEILYNATQLVKQYANAPNSFTTTTLLVATWSRVLPTSTQIFQENSFQLGLVTDHVTTYVLYGYKRGDMSWSTVTGISPLIGFSAASVLLQTHPLSGTPNAHEISLSSGRDVTIIGYTISRDYDDIMTSQQRCSVWEQTTSIIEVDFLICPCTLIQAMIDERFTADRISPLTDGLLCYISLFEIDGPTQRCCYYERLMTLITEGIFRGSSLLTNPTTTMAAYILGDYYGYKECCLLSDTCAVYFSKRVSNDCSAYRPPGVVWGFGLSHIVTADNNQYKVNNVGEYWLLMSTLPCPIQLQVRTEEFGEFNVTSFTALSLSESECNTRIFITTSPDKTHILVYLNGSVILSSQDTSCVTLTILVDVATVRLRFSSGYSLNVWVSHSVLNFNMFLPVESCINRTSGLIGQWDDDVSNDLLMRNGTLLSQNVTDREKEEFADSWKITQEESLMIYETGDYSAYNPLDFESTKFIDEIISMGASSGVTEQCMGTIACIFDQLVSGEELLANNSRDVFLTSFNIRSNLDASAPYLSGASDLLISTREPFSYSLAVVNTPHPIVVSIHSPIRDVMLSFSDDVYSVEGELNQEIGEFEISISVRDVTTGLLSVFSPNILLCTCPFTTQCSFSPLQQMVQQSFYNLSCGCDKGFSVTQGHTCIVSPECLIQMDLLFVLDGSSKIGLTRFSEEVDFTLTLIERFNYPAGTVGNRVGFMVFSENVVMHAGVSENFSAISAQLASVTFPDGNSNLTAPLHFILTNIFTEETVTQTTVVLLTAGSSTQVVDTGELAQLSEELEKERGVRVVVIGIGSDLNELELRSVATGDNDMNYLEIESVTNAQNYLAHIIWLLCKTVVTPPTTATSVPTDYTTFTTQTNTAITTPTTPPFLLVTLKFALSYFTLATLTNGDIQGFLSSIVQALDNKVPVGTILSMDGRVEVSFEVNRNLIDPLRIQTILSQSGFSFLSYLEEVLITEYTIYLGLAPNSSYYVAAAAFISLIILLMCTHTQLELLLGRTRMKLVQLEESSQEETEDEDEVSSMLYVKRTKITRPAGESIPRKSEAVTEPDTTERAVSVRSESASYYGKSSVSEIPLFKPRARIMSRPLSPEQINDLLQESPPYTIQLEFNALPMNYVSVDEMPPGTEAKNRYPNVLPPPHSRVPLFLKYNLPTSDYINASFIRGYNMMSRTYIATQGPMYNTMEEFWRMIWEQRCELILMLTELMEHGKHKCVHYWPDKDVSTNAIFGDLEVTPVEKDYKSSYIVSRFKIKQRTDLENKEIREVIHFWFKQWPDYGIPETGIPIITLLLDSRTYARNSQSPILVHCSSGIGRSGVFVAVDIGMHELEKKGRADLLKIISLLRQDRGGMVQTQDQYLLIYKTLLAYSDFLKKAQQPD